MTVCWNTLAPSNIFFNIIGIYYEFLSINFDLYPKKLQIYYSYENKSGQKQDHQLIIPDEEYLYAEIESSCIFNLVVS